MSKIIYVIDTSYLLELFQVPNFSNPSSSKQIRQLFKAATRRRALFMVPIPCLFELADHISDVSDGNQRRQLANTVIATVRKSVDESTPWTITPRGDADLLNQLDVACQEFAHEHAHQGVSLTDCFTVAEARRLSAKYRGFDYRVHIWTKDSHLKALEPDTEQQAFTG